MMRTVHALHAAHRDDIADLVTRRPLPGPRLPQVDPFLFLNHHGPQVYPPNNRGLPFGPHPHRGFETVTFILDGNLAHYDSGGHASVIEAGGVQWMTAGSGLVHAEVSPPEFKQAVLAAIDAGAERVIVDLTQVTFIDSSSLGVLIGAHRRLKGRGGNLIVACNRDAILKTFRITGLDGVFKLVADVDEALSDPRAAA